MATFGELKLAEDLCQAIASLGYRSPTAFQTEAIPVLLRGTPAVGVASAGSGKTLAYAVALLERIDADAHTTQALVLRPSDAQSANTALLVHRLGRSREGVATALSADRLAETAGGQVVVGSPRLALEAVRRSYLKVESARVFVVDGLSDMLEWGAGSDLDALVPLLPKEAQRAIFTARLTTEVEDWLERHLRRARRLGAQGAAGLGAPRPEVAELPAEHAVDTPARWVERAAAALESARAKGVDRAIVFCRTQAEAESAADALIVRGFDLAAGPEAPGVSVVWDEEPRVAGAVSLSFGAPPDAGTLRRRCDGAARAVFLVPPDEAAHLRAAAAHARVRLQPLRAPLQEDALRSLQDLRARIRAAAAERDLAPYLLVLEPLFADLTPAEAAAAAVALLREKTPEGAEAPKVPAWTRLYFSVGKKDGVRPADLVGCVTGEAGIPGAQVGRIDLRETFSVVEVAAEVAERVLRALSNVTVRGRAVNARPFREHG